jgi:predicted Zn-dependent protease
MGIFDHSDNQQPRQSSGLGRRLILALVIALIGWGIFMIQTERNPITGEKQHVSISPDQEIRLGLESAPTMARQMGGILPATDPRAMEVQRIGELLVSKSIPTNSPWKFQFHLLADPRTVNAFALPGGQIFITLGLLNKLKTEAQLAGVLGHEVGHVIERHVAEQMAKSQLGQMLITAVNSTASDPYQAAGRGGYAPAVLASFVNQMVQLRYGRKDESEADIWGLKMMEQAGFDPTAMIGVMQVLKEAGGEAGQMPEIFLSHPNPDLRIEQIKAYLKEHPPSPDLSEGRQLKDIYGTGTGIENEVEGLPSLQDLFWLLQKQGQ